MPLPPPSTFNMSNYFWFQLRWTNMDLHHTRNVCMQRLHCKITSAVGGQLGLAEINVNDGHFRDDQSSSDHWSTSRHLSSHSFRVPTISSCLINVTVKYMCFHQHLSSQHILITWRPYLFHGAASLKHWPSQNPLVISRSVADSWLLICDYPSYKLVCTTPICFYNDYFAKLYKI